MPPKDVKPGQTVLLDFEEWTVLDKAPGPKPVTEAQVRSALHGRGWTPLPVAPIRNVPGFYWLHRHADAYQTAIAHARDLTLVGEPYREAKP